MIAGHYQLVGESPETFSWATVFRYQKPVRTMQSATLDPFEYALLIHMVCEVIERRQKPLELF